MGNCQGKTNTFIIYMYRLQHLICRHTCTCTISRYFVVFIVEFRLMFFFVTKVCRHPLISPLTSARLVGCSFCCG